MSDKYWRLADYNNEETIIHVFRVKPTAQKIVEKTGLGFDSAMVLVDTGLFRAPYCYRYDLYEEEYDD